MRELRVLIPGLVSALCTLATIVKEFPEFSGKAIYPRQSLSCNDLVLLFLRPQEWKMLPELRRGRKKRSIQGPQNREAVPSSRVGLTDFFRQNGLKPA